jgi:hypothetical protein
VESAERRCVKGQTTKAEMAEKAEKGEMEGN